jgi:hypothetical protein
LRVGNMIICLEQMLDKYLQGDIMVKSKNFYFSNFGSQVIFVISLTSQSPRFLFCKVTVIQHSS